MQSFADWGLLCMLRLKCFFSTQLLCAARFWEHSVFFKGFSVYYKQHIAISAYPETLDPPWCARTGKFYHAVVRHSLELCSFQKKLDGLRVHACINDTALAYYLQCFQKALYLQHILSNIDLHVYSQLDLSRGVELTEYLQTIREAFAASQKHWLYCAYIMWRTCPYFCVGTPGKNYGSNKQVFKAEENEWRNNVLGESEEKGCDK